jgi:hypothetical protein
MKSVCQLDAFVEVVSWSENPRNSNKRHLEEKDEN